MMIYEKLEKKEYFSDIDIRLADYFLENPLNLEKQSAREIARILYVSASSITRFTQKLGYDGFNEFKEAFLEEYHYLNSHFKQIDPNKPFEKTNTSEQITGKINTLYHETIEDTFSLIDYKQLEKITDLIYQSRFIYFTSGGSQTNLGKMFREKMNWIGKIVHVFSHLNEAFESVMFSQSDTCYILVSYSGETYQTLKLAEHLKKINRKFIVITSYGQNSLSQMTDYVLYVSTREKLNDGIGNYGFNISVLYLLDIIYSCVFQKNYEYNIKNKPENMKKFQNLRHSTNPIIKDE